MNNKGASAFLQKQAETSTFWRGAALYNRCLQAAELDQRATWGTDFLYRYGYEFLGMAYSVYIHSVIEKIDHFGIDHVMFVARKGYLFLKIYEILTGYRSEADGLGGIRPSVTTHYAYLSKASTLLASVSPLSARELALIADKSEQQGLWDLFEALGLPPGEFEFLARSHDINLRSPLQDYWNNQTLLAFLSDRQVQTRVSKYQQQARATLSQYLSQCGFFGRDRKVALIDIGWEGTLQDSLVHAFHQRPDFPLLHGFYFGLRGHKGALKYASSFSHGLIYEARNRNINAESINIFTDIFEWSAGAPHATTKGYAQLGDRVEDGVEPVFESDASLARQAELRRRGAIAAMQQGILDFAHQYGQQWQQQRFRAETSLPFVQGSIARHIAFPTHEEAYRIAVQLGTSETHAMGLNENLGKALDAGLSRDTAPRVATTTKDFWSPLKLGRLATSLARLRRSAWLPASFRLTKIPGMASFYRIKRFLSF